MTGPVELQSSLEDLEVPHRLAAPDRSQLPPHSANVPVLGLAEPR